MEDEENKSYNSMNTNTTHTTISHNTENKNEENIEKEIISTITTTNTSYNTSFLPTTTKLTKQFITLISTRPQMEKVVMYVGGVLSAITAAKYANGVRSALFVGLLSGILTHSVYADVLQKKTLKTKHKKRKQKKMTINHETKQLNTRGRIPKININTKRNDLRHTEGLDTIKLNEG